jgi:hypothetical protein
MKRCITIEGDAVRLSLSNLGSVEGIEEIDLGGSDINDAEDIREVMETIDAYAQSGELDARTDIVRYTVVSPEAITLGETKEDESEESERTLDDFELDNIATDDIAELLRNAEAGDIVYLRREEGKGLWHLCVETDENDKLAFDYIDCAALDLGRYDLLNEAYFAYLCDGILPKACTPKRRKAKSSAVCSNRASSTANSTVSSKTAKRGTNILKKSIFPVTISWPKRSKATNSSTISTLKTRRFEAML